MNGSKCCPTKTSTASESQKAPEPVIETTLIHIDPSGPIPTTGHAFNDRRSENRLKPTKTTIAFVRPNRLTLGFPEIYGLLVLAAVFAARFIPFSLLINGCAFKRFTGGWPCLSCGMTRCFDWFARGRFSEAFFINPLGFCLALTGVILSAFALLFPLRPPRPTVILSESDTKILRRLLIAILLFNWTYLLVRHALGGRI